MLLHDDDYADIYQDVKDFAEKEVRTLAFNITSTLRDIPLNGGTPIDTGFARSNWVLSVGAPSSSVYGNKTWDKTTHRYIAELDDSGHSGGVAQVAAWRAGDGDIYITNNVEYINLLNTTKHSEQQKPRFVERAIQKGLSEIGAQRAAQQTATISSRNKVGSRRTGRVGSRRTGRVGSGRRSK